MITLGINKLKTQTKMKKTIWALALLGAFAVSCGQKETKNTETTTVENTAETTVADQKIALKHKIEWKAFKTAEKVGVKGSFDKVALTDVNADAPTLAEALEGANFEVETATVNTNDAGRDSKLKDYFFQKMNGNITGTFGAFKDGKVLVSLTMNGITKEKEFAFEADEDSIELKGSIDIIADFSANTAFQSLHEICKDLHEGKTWTDVEIEVEIEK